MKRSLENIPKLISKILLAIVIGHLYLAQFAFAQKATIKEEIRSLKTYAFGKPNPVPILTENPKIYPYFKFNEYEHEGMPKDWKVVVMENDYIRLFVLPQAGGKVWGAIEKSTGKEFIYRNEVMKFRNIAMRGPWTSGGIEFNFGIIGHTPATATPVDYLIKENEDGSVSCVVGNIDLPSRTQWRVIITLPKDAAYFETQALWYNPTTQQQSYYNWMTAAAVAKDDLEFFCPGNQYLKHSGEPMPWPYDVNENKISVYKENDYGNDKSYHVVGEYNDFFGGYYHRDKFGFGHWSLYEEMPGQKLWLWALSRSGGIWEDLLTDTDGQYIEFQAGRLFNQYFPGDHQNPITQATFAPYSTDTWREIWFPVKEIGGMTDVSPYGALHVTINKNKVSLGINALQKVEGTLEVRVKEELVYSERLQLNPMDVFTKDLVIDENDTPEISIKEMDLFYDPDPKSKVLDRPFASAVDMKQSESEKLYAEGLEMMEYRAYAGAREKFEACLKLNATDRNALISLAELLYGTGAYKKALLLVKDALRLDTYDPEANYVAGSIYRSLNDPVNALEALGWAARSMEFRSVSYAQMSEIYLSQKNLNMARHYAEKALDFNRYNVKAYEAMITIARKNDDIEKAKSIAEELLKIDPLNHFAYFEEYLLNNTSNGLERFKSRIQNEFPNQTYMELAIDYYNKGLNEEAIALFNMTDQNPVAQFWLAYLNRSNENNAQKYIETALSIPPDFVFPFRRETLSVFAWVLTKDQDWKTKYYTALNFWAKNRTEEAAELLASCGEEPDYFAFYLARANLLNKIKKIDQEEDIKKAMELAKDDWLVWNQLTHYYKNQEHYTEELKIAGGAFKKFPGNYNLGLNYARSLLHNDMYAKCIKVLSDINILPFEGASESRGIYEQAHILLALQHIQKKKYKSAITVLESGLEWPENIGVGKPYDPDMRKMEFLLAYCHAQLNQSDRQADYHKKVIDYTGEYFSGGSADNLLGLIVLKNNEAKVLENKILKYLKENSKMTGVKNKWVLAMYEGDQSGIENKGDNFFQSQNYIILKKILEVTNTKL
ncbi:DUF5107 domain-containing protein [Fulvivirgaceae bacterium BMA10]|uniref:DUF5107 domain-containing protein n=1 Tax=Splendidivirga corallicola TaxID=3051826 RepID=A0ABT8KHU9_9BACT|nr:DUF5107 domain-containing protein [Fulvivirgaceae bacterium BMA10]